MGAPGLARELRRAMQPQSPQEAQAAEAPVASEPRPPSHASARASAHASGSHTAQPRRGASPSWRQATKRSPFKKPYWGWSDGLMIPH